MDVCLCVFVFFVKLPCSGDSGFRMPQPYFSGIQEPSNQGFIKPWALSPKPDKQILEAFRNLDEAPIEPWYICLQSTTKPASCKLLGLNPSAIYP